MFRFVFRFVGLMLIALSFLFVVQDGTKSIADQTVYISRVASTWENIHPSSLSAFEPAVEKLAGAWVWSDVIQPYFLATNASSSSSLAPSWSCLGARRSRGSPTRGSKACTQVAIRSALVEGRNINLDERDTHMNRPGFAGGHLV